MGPTNFWAFISYSRKDGQVAKSLHTKLETYKVPHALIGEKMRASGENRPSRLFPICLDREDFSAGADLTESIKNALRHSRYLIVVCSPNAAESAWVDREIEFFESTGRAHKILAVIIDGDPDGKDGVPCFPPALVKSGKVPLAADLRKTGDGEANARLKLLATMLEVNFDNLKQRDYKRHVQRLEYILATSSLLALVFAFMTWYSNEQRKRAVAAREQAENMVEFLLFDLQEKLEPIGRLGLLRAVQARVDDYYRKSGEDNAKPHMMHNRATAYQNEGQRLLAEGSLDKAHAAFLACREINDRLARQDPRNPIWQRDLSVSTLQVGDILLRKGNLYAAVEAYKASYRSQQRLQTDDPTNPARLRDIAVCHGRMGDAFSSGGDITNALHEYEAALAIRVQLAKCNDGDENARRDLSVSQEKMGDILLAQGEIDRASACYKSCLQTRQQLAKTFSSDTGLQRELTLVHDKLGDLFYDAGQLAESLQHYGDSFAIRKQLTDSDPENRIWQRDISVSFGKIGDLLMEQGHFKEALAEYTACLNICKEQALRDRSNANTQRDLWVACWKMGESLECLHDPAHVRYWIQARDTLLDMKNKNVFLSLQDQEALNTLIKKVSSLQQS